MTQCIVDLNHRVKSDIIAAEIGEEKMKGTARHGSVYFCAHQQPSFCDTNR